MRSEDERSVLELAGREDRNLSAVERALLERVAESHTKLRLRYEKILTSITAPLDSEDTKS